MSKPADFSQIPVVDVSALMAGTAGQSAVAAELGTACRDFFMPWDPEVAYYPPSI